LFADFGNNRNETNFLKWQFLGQGRKASKLGGAYDFLFFVFCPHFGSCNFLHCCICIESGKMAWWGWASITVAEIDKKQSGYNKLQLNVSNWLIQISNKDASFNLKS
jgi:hypothetical protein